MTDKMVYDWEVDDVVCGHYVGKPAAETSDEGWLAKWTFKFGYYGGNGRMCLISMTDGAITLRDCSRGELVFWLRTNKMVPLNDHDIMNIIKYIRENK